MIASKKLYIEKSRPGFSLIETVISLSIVSILFLGLSSAVMIGSHAIPTAAETGEADRAVIDGLNVLRRDLRLASGIRKQSNTEGSRLTIQFENYGVQGQPREIIYQYIKADGTFTRSTDGGDDILLFDRITSIANSFKLDGTRATSTFILLTVDGTIQPTFEFNVILPTKPEYS